MGTMRNSLTILNQTLTKTQLEEGLEQRDLESENVLAGKIVREIELKMTVVALPGEDVLAIDQLYIYPL